MLREEEEKASALDLEGDSDSSIERMMVSQGYGTGNAAAARAGGRLAGREIAGEVAN